MSFYTVMSARQSNSGQIHGHYLYYCQQKNSHLVTTLTAIPCVIGILHYSSPMTTLFILLLLLLVDLTALLRGFPYGFRTDSERVMIFRIENHDSSSETAKRQGVNTSTVEEHRRRSPIPVSLRELEEKLMEQREPLPSFKMLPRRAFDDIAFPPSARIPVLMEAFTYCQENDLMLNSVINLFYLGENIKFRKDYRFSKCTAQLDGVVANDTMVDDPLARVIVSAFRFPGMCSSQNREIAITCDTINNTYRITPVHIHYEKTTRYYLSVCTSIADVSPLLVRAWIYYYFANGVEHFTFYLNEQQQFWKRVLRDFQQTGLVDLIDFEYKYHISHRDQEPALESCNLRYRNTSKFVIYNDIDEFFVPINPKWRIVDVVHLYDTLYPKADAFRVSPLFRIESVGVPQLPRLRGSQ